MNRNSIGREAAIALYNTKWWETKSHRDITTFQFFTKELCCPLEVFHEAVEKSLGRPVFTHEFDLAYEQLVNEFMGQITAPTLEEIMNLIPEAKRVIIVTS